jgi:drug/metabolite transporter (DMT)-like permease
MQTLITSHWGTWSEERKGVVLAILAATGFSLKAIFVKLAYAAAPVDAVTLLSLRMLFSAPIFIWVGVRVWRNGPVLQRKDWVWVIVLGLLGYYSSSMLDFLGLQYISAALERLILFTYPTITIMIGVVCFGNKLDRRQVGAIVLSYLGISLAFVHDLSITDSVVYVTLGAALVFGSAISYAAYNAGAEKLIHRIGSLRFAVLATLVSTTATQIHFFMGHTLTGLVQPTSVYLNASAMALFSTVLPVFWQSSAIRFIGSARTVLIGTIGPVLTILFGWMILDETASIEQSIGAMLVLVGVMLVIKKKAAKAQDLS